MPSIHNRSSKEWGLLGSALLLTLSTIPLCSYAEKHTQSNLNSVVMMPTAVSNSNLSMEDEDKNKKTFNLSRKKISKIMLLEKRHQHNPDNPEIAASLATAYVQMARKKSDAHYYRLANEVIKPWARQPTIPGLISKAVPIEIRLIRATLSQHDHHYADASDDLFALIKQQPRNAQAWLTLSTIQLVQGDYKKAQVSCSALSRVSSRWMATLCYSQLYSLTGAAKRAYKMQQGLLSQLMPQQKELRLWVTGLMAETALRLGDNVLAEKHFKDAIKIKANDTYVLRTYSDFLLAQQRYKEVKLLLTSLTDNDQLLLRFAIASKYSDEASKIEPLIKQLEQRFANALAKNNHIHGRDEALFLLEFKADKVESREYALKLAEINWKTQKEPDDALILLRASHANKNRETAKLVIEWIKKSKLQDPRISL